MLCFVHLMKETVYVLLLINVHDTSSGGSQWSYSYTYIRVHDIPNTYSSIV